MRGIRPSLFAFAVMTAAAVAGCGGDDGYVAARNGTVSVHLEEYRVSPQRITVPAGRIRIIGRNDGVLTHNVAVVQLERPLGDEEEQRFARTPTAHPGQRVETTVTLKPGRYRLICTIGNHDNLGQYGELRVTGTRTGSS